MQNDNVEVTRISSLGIWLRAYDRKYFLSYYDFPGFRQQPLQSVLSVEEIAPNHYHWPLIGLAVTAGEIEQRTAGKRVPPPHAASLADSMP